MNERRHLVSWQWLLAGLCALAICQCGGSSSNSNPGTGGSAGSGGKGAGGGGTAGSTSIGGAGGPGGSSGAAGTSNAGAGGTTGAGGAAGTTGAAGATASSPDRVLCGASSCDTTTSYCCRTSLDSGAETCVDNAATCTGGSSFRCDEAGDCATGEQCCVGGMTAQGGLSTGCSSPCNMYLLCNGDQDCPSGKTCVTQICHFGTVSQIVQTCSALPSTFCPS